MRDSYTQAELDEVRGRVTPRVGWDFSRMNTERAPVPWEYPDVVARFLRPSDDVLDIGTGDGRQLAGLANRFGRGLGIGPDAEMIRLAATAYGSPALEFRRDDARLRTVRGAFPVMLCRHAVLDLPAAVARLAPGGYLITQQVGERNMQCLRAALGEPDREPPITAQLLTAAGLQVAAFAEYDVEYVVRDLDSLVFWLVALDLAHADLAGAPAVASADALNAVLAGNVDARGFVTNEHRYLAIGRKPGRRVREDR